MTKKSIKERLQLKTVVQLKAIYFRRNGKDLLRGNKHQMIQTLEDNLLAPSRWESIAN